MARKNPSKVESSLSDPELDKLLEGVNPKKSMAEGKFQKILDHYMGRNPDRATALTGIKLYVWRTFPRIDNRKSGRKFGNIETIVCVEPTQGGATSIEEVKELPTDLRAWLTARFGGGRFQIRVNDGNRKSESEEVALTTIKIDEIENPPILNPVELVDSDSETMGWITRQLQMGLLARVGTPPNVSYAYPGDAAAARPAASAEPGLAQVAMKAMEQRTDGAGDHAARRSIDLIADTAAAQIKGMQPAVASDPVAQVRAIAEVLKGDGGGMTAMIPLLITMMQENGKSQMEASRQQAQAQSENMKLQMQMMTMQMEMLTKGRGRDGDDVAKLDKLVSLATRMGGGGGGIADTIKEYIPLLLPFLFRGMGAPGAAPPAVPQPALPPADATPSAVAGAQPGARLTPAQIEDFSNRALTCMNRGQDGSDFANGIEVIFSPAAYDTLRAIGKDNLIAVLLQSTKAAQFQEKGAATAQFVQEFIDYGNVEGETAPPAGVPTAAPPPVAVQSKEAQA